MPVGLTVEGWITPDESFETQPASNSYYVLTEDNQVYVCLKPSKASSKPWYFVPEIQLYLGIT